MKKLVLNLSGKPLEYKDIEEVPGELIIISPFKGESTLIKNVKKWVALPYSYNFSSSANYAFWMTNYFIDKRINNFHQIKDVMIFTPFWLKYKEFKIEKLKTPIIDHYFRDTFIRLNDRDVFELWKEGIDSTLDIDKYRGCYKLIDEKSWKGFKSRVKKIYLEKYDLKVVNGGNEGIILKKDKDTLIKIIKKSEEEINELLKKSSEKDKYPKPTWALDAINNFYNFDIKICKCEDKNEIRFKYPNILLPTCNINYAFQAHSLIKQKSLKILIDDNKIENYAKYLIDGTETLFKPIFNDFGRSFIKYDNDKDYDKMFFSITRDNYYFVKNFRHHNLRQKIRDRRKFDKPEMIKDRKFHVFYNFVTFGYKNIKQKRACEREDLPKSGKWLFCNSHQNTMTRIWEKHSNKYLDLTELNEDKVIECNCSNLLNQIVEEKKKEYFELDLNLNMSFTSYEVNFGPKIIALLTTEGTRDISKSLKCIESQTKKVENIFIASEIPLKNCKYNVLVNPYEKGLSRNTMQALSKIKLKYKNDDVYVCTLDDDDLWKANYIKLVSSKIKEGYNFIGCDLEVFENGNKIDVWKYKESDVNINQFLCGNPGLQGSNKAFDLKIALESGGMPKHINASTDRAFNINLLLHPKIKFGKINSAEVIFNKDSNRKRISNDSKRADELRKFYKHFWHLIDKDMVEKINNRHKTLHGFDEVITWK